MKLLKNFPSAIGICMLVGLAFTSCSSPNAEEKTKAPDSNLAEVAGIYQMYVDGEPLDQNGQMFYLLNAQGVVLTTFGESASTAFQNVEQGLSSGLVTTGTFKVSGDNLTFELEKSNGPTEWKIDAIDKTISRDKVSLKFVQEID